MRLATYEQLRTSVQANGTPATAGQLTAMAGRLCDLLSHTALFDWFEVGTTEDPDRLVVAMCHLRPESSDVVVAQRLEAIWSDSLLRPSWGAHVVSREDGQVELQGATMASDQGHFVTVHVLATKARVPEQRRSLARHTLAQASAGVR